MRMKLKIENDVGDWRTLEIPEYMQQQLLEVIELFNQVNYAGHKQATDAWDKSIKKNLGADNG